MKMKKLHAFTLAAGFALATGVAQGRTIPGGAVEQIEDITVHTILGTSDPGVLTKLGNNFDGGDGVALMKWDVSGFASPLASVIGDFAVLNSGDGSFSIHQMTTAWNESTDFGTTLPIAGVDYVASAIGAIGFNESKRVDQVDLSKLFQYWQANPSQNNGLILVGRGQLNSAYPNSTASTATPTGVFNNEVQLAASERVVGLDGDDTWVVPTGGSITQQTNTLKPIEETSIIENLPNWLLFSDFPTVGLFNKTGNRQIPLMRFGLGELQLDSAVASVADADFQIHTNTPGKPGITFGVHKMLTNWDEATTTWAQFGAGGPVAGVDYEAVAEAITTIGDGTAVATVDLTDLVNEWLANPSADYGVILVPISATSDADNVAIVGSENVLGVLDSGDTRLVVTVPEPASFGLVALGGLVLMSARRR